jgi:hypothetical protein
MKRQRHKRPRMFKPPSKVTLAVGGGLLVWIALLISPVGSVVAAVTIFGIIGFLFVLGCINVQEDDHRK